MTTATVHVSGNAIAVWLVIGIVAIFGIVAVLVRQERIVIRQGKRTDRHAEQLATLAYQMPKLLEFLGIDIPPAVVDDSPEAMAASPTNAGSSPTVDPDADTGEIPVCPPTQPDGIAIQVQSALIERPVPHKRDDEWVERSVNIGGTVQTFRIRAHREDVT